MVLEGQQRGRGGKPIIGAKHADSDLVRLPVAEQAREGCKVNAIRSEIQRLHAGDGTPQQRIDSAGVYPRIDWSNARRCAINGDLAFAESAAAAALQFISYIIGHACVPELIARLALRDNINKRALNIGRKSKSLCQRTAGVGEKSRSSRWIGSQRQNQVGSARRVFMTGQRVELDFGRPEKSAGECGVH